MSPEELDEFLTVQRVCRVATVGADGSPHVAPLWFVWDGERLWLNSVVRSRRWADLMRDPRVAVTVDAGEAYGELRGVEIRGVAEVVGEVPRPATGGPAGEHERLFADKYAGGVFVADGAHAWLRIVPSKIVSWDFRKLGRAGSGN